MSTIDDLEQQYANLSRRLAIVEADARELLAENKRLKNACQAALEFDAHDEDCATQHPRHSKSCDCKRAQLVVHLKTVLGA